MNIWGIDLGGTKIECAVLSQNLSVITRQRIDTEAHLGYQHIIAQIKKLVDTVAEIAGEYPNKIGFSTPGVLDPGSQTMKNCNTVCMNGQAMKTDIEKVLGIEARLANDANCFALAETLMGAASKINPTARVVFGVIMGTGVGGGLVVDGKAVYGKHGIGGEWGHNIIEENGPACYCGKSGCVENVISGPALQKYYEKLSGNTLKMKEIVDRHLAGLDPAASQTVDRLLEYYGRGISTIINVIDPDVIIIGGGVGNIDLLYTEGYERIKKYIFNNQKLETPIVKPLLGDSAGVFGAALLFNN
jgi:fructokinase